MEMQYEIGKPDVYKELFQEDQPLSQSSKSFFLYEYQKIRFNQLVKELQETFHIFPYIYTLKDQ